MATMTNRWTRWMLALALGLAAATVAPAKDVDAKRQEVRDQSKAALERLYAAEPSARAAIERSAGYATFSTFGIKLGVGGTGKGRGLAVTMPEGKETFMRFVEVQAGIGAGVKRYDLVFVFDSPEAMTRFLTKGWEYGSQVTAAAKTKDDGKAYTGAASVSEGVWLYQLTTSGLAAEVTIKGSKYFPDDKLN